MLLGQHLDDNGLDRIRVEILKIYGSGPPSYSGAGSAPVQGLLNGPVLEQADDDGDPFGLGESPLG